MNKELKALESIYWYIVATGAEDDYKKYYEEIKKALKDAKKYKKALKIIKSEILDNLTFNDERQQITLEWGLIRPSVKIEDKEEYEFLKEVMKND